MTDAFASEVAEPVFEIGHFELRGFRQHQAVYGMCREGEATRRAKHFSANSGRISIGQQGAFK
jgi:hypothetical protein